MANNVFLILYKFKFQMWFWLPNKITFVKWSTAYDLSRQINKTK